MWLEQNQPSREDAEPYGWWGFGWDVPDPLSIVDLIAAGNFDARTAALLWLLMEARSSIVVAADPPGAGKTTTLTALSDFLPLDLSRIYLRGWNETFDFLGTADPARSYLLCNEISAHLPVYLWGRKVQQLFAALGDGFAFGATMHADEPDEVIGILAGYPLYIPLPAIARLDLIMTLAVEYVARRPRRRLDRLVLLRRSGEGDDFDPVSLAWWDRAADGVVGFEGPPPPGLLRRTGLTEAEFGATWARRAAFLADLATQERQDRAVVRQQISNFRN